MQLANPAAGGVEDRVADRGHHTHPDDLAEPLDSERVADVVGDGVFRQGRADAPSTRVLGTLDGLPHQVDEGGAAGDVAAVAGRWPRPWKPFPNQKVKLKRNSRLFHGRVFI